MALGQLTEMVGALAAVLTTASFVPQAVKLLVSRETAAISLTMYLIFGFGVSLWVVYGVALGSWPVILANAATLALVLAIIAAKLRYG